MLPKQPFLFRWRFVDWMGCLPGSVGSKRGVVDKPITE